MDRFPPVYRLATSFSRLYFSFRGGVRVSGAEHAPALGGMILASVHVSDRDPPALAIALKKRRLRAMAKQELWNNRIFGWIIQGIGAFPVKRGSGDIESIRTCISILQGGEAVIVFPEGHRNDGVTLNPLQPGVPMLAKKSGVPVVPAGIAGTQKGGKGPISVVFGKPLLYEEFARNHPGVGEKQLRQMFLDELEIRLLELCRQAGRELKSATSKPCLQGGSSPEKESEGKVGDWR